MKVWLYWLRYSRFCMLCDQPVSRWRLRSHQHLHPYIQLSGLLEELRRQHPDAMPDDFQRWPDGGVVLHPMDADPKDVIGDNEGKCS
jgi:hypothetical protein